MPDPAPRPLPEGSEGLQSFLDGVTGIVEATDFERQCLWEENERFAKREWLSNLCGRIEHVGRLDDMPICISMWEARIGGRHILFWHATSQVVDYRQIDLWLKQVMPKSAYRRDAINMLNRVDAANFYNVFR